MSLKHLRMLNAAHQRPTNRRALLVRADDVDDDGPEHRKSYTGEEELMAI